MSLFYVWRKEIQNCLQGCAARRPQCFTPRGLSLQVAPWPRRAASAPATVPPLRYWEDGGARR